jgi:hypothetical protein
VYSDSTSTEGPDSMMAGARMNMARKSCMQPIQQNLGCCYRAGCMWAAAGVQCAGMLQRHR